MHTKARLEVTATDTGETVLTAHAGRGTAEVSIIARVSQAGFHSSPEEMQANARRLAACWNLCLGIPDQALAACAGRHSAADRLDALTRAVRNADASTSDIIPPHGKPSNWHG